MKYKYEGGEDAPKDENAPLNPEEPVKAPSSSKSSAMNSADRAKLAVANKEAFVCCCCICQCSVKQNGKWIIQLNFFPLMYSCNSVSNMP